MVAAMSVEAPERIWVTGSFSQGQYAHGSWNASNRYNPKADYGGVEYVRADKLEELAAEVERVRDGNRYAHLEQIAIKRANKAEAALAEAKRDNEALREALTPSGATKAEYIGEFSFYMEFDLGGACEVSRKVFVPWTTIKEIMKAIADRAARNAGGNNGE